MEKKKRQRIVRRIHRRSKEKRKKLRSTRNYRYDIKNEDVKEKLDEGWTISKCAILFSCSKNLIKSVREGKRPALKRKRKLPKKRCSCCGLRKVAKGNRFLCKKCYRKKECGSIAVHGYPFSDYDVLF